MSWYPLTNVTLSLFIVGTPGFFILYIGFNSKLPEISFTVDLIIFLSLSTNNIFIGVPFTVLLNSYPSNV